MFEIVVQKIVNLVVLKQKMEKKTLHKKVPLWRKTVEILGTALLCGLIAFLICHFMVTPQYQATATMEVSFAHLPEAFYTSFETGVDVDLAKEYAGLFRLDSTRYNAAGAAGIDVAEIDKNISVSAVPGTHRRPLYGVYRSGSAADCGCRA